MNQLTNHRSTSAADPSSNIDPVADHLTRVWQNALDVDEHGSRYLARPIDGDARSILERRLRDIEGILAPARTDFEMQRAAGAIAGMLSGYFGARTSDTKATLAAYCATTAELPVWAIQEACRRISNRQVPDLNPDFPPSAARLYEVIGGVLMKLHRERHQIRQILEARPKDAQATPPSARARILAGLKTLSEQLKGASSTFDSDAAKRERTARAHRIMLRTDHEIEAEWRALGIAVVPLHDGRPISVSLAKQLGLIKVDAEQQEAV